MTGKEYAARVAKIREDLEKSVNALFSETMSPPREDAVAMMQASRDACGIAEIGAAMLDRIDGAPARGANRRTKVRKALGYTYP